MKATAVFLGLGLLVLGGTGSARAADYQDKVKVAVESVGLHPGMDPGTYVCALGHLHIKGTVQNQADVNLGRIELVGRAFDADGKLLGTARAATKQETLTPNQKAEFNLEFLTVTGPKIKQVKKHEEQVIAAPVRQ
jgi:hypothetical protein